jgi:hypothetical protein
MRGICSRIKPLNYDSNISIRQYIPYACRFDPLRADAVNGYFWGTMSIESLTMLRHGGTLGVLDDTATEVAADGKSGDHSHRGCADSPGLKGMKTRPKFNEDARRRRI